MRICVYMYMWAYVFLQGPPRRELQARGRDVAAPAPPGAALKYKNNKQTNSK